MPKTMSVSFISEVDKGNESCYPDTGGSGVSRIFGMQIYFGQPFIHQLFVLKSRKSRIEVGKVVCQLHAEHACHEILERALV
jgi:hypothetical protein